MKNIKRIINYAVMAVLLAVFLFSAAMLAWHFYGEYKSAESFKELTALLSDTEKQQTETELQAAEAYAAAKSKNSDLAGWIKIEGTPIDYPVMQTPDRQDYYLRRGFDKKYSYYGVPYAAEQCNVDNSSNVVIYGHNMKNGTMFSALENYLSQSFYSEHKLINFDTLSGYGTYEVMAVFKTVIDPESGFAYYRFSDGDKTSFDEYVAKCKELALYDTGVTANYGDRLITLSTCEYTQKNGRLVVVAKKTA